MLEMQVALFVANGTEWYTHKYELHGTPQECGGPKSPDTARMKNNWSHHRHAPLTQYSDDDLHQHPLKNDSGRLEVLLCSLA